MFSRPASRSARPSAASGCFSAGCCWGIATHVPWAVTFRNPQAAELTGVPLGIPLHPTQLYEIGRRRADFCCSSIFGSRRAHTSGAILGWYLALYSAARFIIEFFRFHEQGLHSGAFLHAVDFARHPGRPVWA